MIVCHSHLQWIVTTVISTNQSLLVVPSPILCLMVKKPEWKFSGHVIVLFSDVLTLWSWTNTKTTNPEKIVLLNTGIAWESDKNIKFRNPPGDDLKKAFENFTKPKAWKKNIWELDENNTDNNGFQNEDLIVWMRTAALPTFRKLYRRIDHSQAGFGSGLLRGDYQLRVEYSTD